MKIAIILTGQTRTLARCLPAINWHVLRPLRALGELTFYASVANDTDAVATDELSKHGTAFVEKVEQPALTEPDAKLADFAPYAISSPVQAILRQLWHLSRGWAFAEASGAGDADIFVRLRPDLHFHRFDLGPVILERGLIGQAFTPWWGTYGGVNDRFAILTSRIAAEAYFKAWDALPALLAAGCPLHPESIVSASLLAAGVEIQPHLEAEFAARRPDGSIVHMVVTPQEMVRHTAFLSRHGPSN